jgi:hypothetical protein
VVHVELRRFKQWKMARQTDPAMSFAVAEYCLAAPLRGMMKRLAMLTAVLLTASVFGAQAQTSDANADHKKPKKAEKKTEGATAEEIRELRDAMKAQQAEIDALKSQLSNRDQQITTVQQSATDAQTQAAAASAAAAQANAAAVDSSSKAATLQTTVTDLKNVNASLTDTVITTQKQIKEEIESPAAFHYKGLTITPVAFFAFEGVWRERSVNSDINTPFNSIPFPAAAEGHVSELNFSGRQSRLGGLFEGNAGTYKLSGYFEADFLGTGTSSNNNQSNSYVLRQRQIWGKAETQGGFAVTGGQTWSLVTEDGKSTDARTEKLPNTVDSQYMVGFSWTRQPAIRIQQRFGDVKTGAVTLAVSAEQAQITSFTANGTNPTDYFFGGPGQNGGLYNAAGNIGAGNAAGTGGITTYANNVSPRPTSSLAELPASCVTTTTQSPGRPPWLLLRPRSSPMTLRTSSPTRRALAVFSVAHASHQPSSSMLRFRRWLAPV